MKIKLEVEFSPKCKGCQYNYEGEELGGCTAPYDCVQAIQYIESLGLKESNIEEIISC